MRKLAFVMLTSLALAAVPSVAMADPTADQLALQENMELLSQFESIFSNVLKSISDTAATVVGNLKG